MRTAIHAIASTLVVLVAAVITLTQVNDVDHAVNHLSHDEQAVIEPAGNSMPGR